MFETSWPPGRRLAAALTGARRITAAPEPESNAVAMSAKDSHRWRGSCGRERHGRPALLQASSTWCRCPLDQKHEAHVFCGALQIKGEAIGRMLFVPFVDEAPIAAENFRQLCSGEKARARVLWRSRQTPPC